MGTQQILLIVLSVIIVGVAIAVGITMFQTQAYNSNKTALASEAAQYGAQVVQWFKTPVSLGGAGAPADLTTDWTALEIGTAIGFGADDDDTTTPPNTAAMMATDTGMFTITSVTAKTVVITAVGTEERGGVNPKSVTTITFPDGDIATETSDAEAS